MTKQHVPIDPEPNQSNGVVIVIGRGACEPNRSLTDYVAGSSGQQVSGRDWIGRSHDIGTHWWRFRFLPPGHVLAFSGLPTATAHFSP